MTAEVKVKVSADTKGASKAIDNLNRSVRDLTTQHREQARSTRMASEATQSMGNMMKGMITMELAKKIFEFSMATLEAAKSMEGLDQHTKETAGSITGMVADAKSIAESIVLWTSSLGDNQGILGYWVNEFKEIAEMWRFMAGQQSPEMEKWTKSTLDDLPGLINTFRTSRDELAKAAQQDNKNFYEVADQSYNESLEALKKYAKEKNLDLKTIETLARDGELSTVKIRELLKENNKGLLDRYMGRAQESKFGGDAEKKKREAEEAKRKRDEAEKQKASVNKAIAEAKANLQSVVAGLQQIGETEMSDKTKQYMEDLGKLSNTTDIEKVRDNITKNLALYSGYLDDILTARGQARDELIKSTDKSLEESIKKDDDLFTKAAQQRQKEQEQLQKEALEAHESFMDEINTVNNSYAFALRDTFKGAFDDILSGEKSFGRAMVDNFKAMISQMISTLLANAAIFGILTLATGGTGAGMSLLGMSGQANAGFNFGKLLGFAGGGVVPGNSYNGDKIPVRVNSGEMILNRDQQSQLYNQLNGGGSNSTSLSYNPVINVASGTNINDFKQVIDSNRKELERLIMTTVNNPSSSRIPAYV